MRFTIPAKSNEEVLYEAAAQWHRIKAVLPVIPRVSADGTTLLWLEVTWKHSEKYLAGEDYAWRHEFWPLESPPQVKYRSYVVQPRYGYPRLAALFRVLGFVAAVVLGTTRML